MLVGCKINISLLKLILALLIINFVTVIFRIIINPRRACAAWVTVLGLCVCLFVCLSVCLSTTILALQATRRLMSDTNHFSATRE